MSETVKRKVKFTVVPAPKLYLILSVKGIDFMDEWFKSNEHIPLELTKLYQLLLRIAMLNGVINVWIAVRLGYDKDVINKAISKAYLELSLMPRDPSNEVLSRIKEIYGEPPEEIYA